MRGGWHQTRWSSRSSPARSWKSSCLTTAVPPARHRPLGAYSAYVLAYDAARFACIALLAQQGLRATTSGGHYAVEQAVRAQFGDGFRPFGALRRRRNELEYPHLPADTATSEEAEQAAGTAQRLIGAAGTLLSQLSFFSQEQELDISGRADQRCPDLGRVRRVADVPQPGQVIGAGRGQRTAVRREYHRVDVGAGIVHRGQLPRPAGVGQ